MGLGTALHRLLCSIRLHDWVLIKHGDILLARECRRCGRREMWYRGKRWL